MTTKETTIEDVATLLENFVDYVNPDGDEAPWFTIDEINQQFAWEDIPEATLSDWLSELLRAGNAVFYGGRWRWAS